MNLIELLKSPQDLMALRDHLGKVLKESLDMPLKSRKLNELTAKLVGAADFNTAQAIAGNTPATHDPHNLPFVVVDISEGVPHIFSSIPIKGIAINNDVHELINAKDNHVPNLVEDLNGKPLACWHLSSEPTDESIAIVSHFRKGQKRIFEAYSEPTSWADLTIDDLKIPALIRSDDGKESAIFDAVDYFDRLDPVIIEWTIDALEKCDFNGDYPADEVALFLSEGPGQENLKRTLNYVHFVNEQSEDRGETATQGFYVEIKKIAVYAWNQQRIAKNIG